MVHLQAPPSQVRPAVQTLAQAPQLLASLASATQVPLQSTCPLAQGVPHEPLRHANGAAHALPQEPQFFASFLASTQLPAHNCSPAAHAGLCMFASELEPPVLTPTFIFPTFIFEAVDRCVSIFATQAHWSRAKDAHKTNQPNRSLARLATIAPSYRIGRRRPQHRTCSRDVCSGSCTAVGSNSA